MPAGPMKSLRRVLRVVVALGTLSVLPGVTAAQAARDYLNTPVDAVTYFGDFLYTSGETAAASEIPLPNNSTITRNGYASLLWSFPLGDKYGGLSLSAGYAQVGVSGPSGNIQTSGFTDPSITFHANIFGAPALRLAEFPQAIPQTFSSFHLTVNAPLGSYDPDSAVNTGANRWAFTPSFNLAITEDQGVSWIDLSAGARFYTNNNAYQGNSQLSQDPLLILSAHYSHNIGTRWWASIGVYYDNGGASYVNHVSQHDSSNAFRPGASISRGFGKYRLILRYENTASKPNASRTNGLLSLRVSGLLFDY